MLYVIILFIFMWIVFYILRNQKITERFENILNKEVREDILTKENMICKPLHNYIDRDIINNYRLISDTENDHKCYLKMSDVLVKNDCDKANDKLYKSNHADVITNIAVEKIKDPHVSQTMYSDVCMLEFSSNSTDESKQEYVDFLDQNDPRYKILYDEKVVLDKLEQGLNKEISSKENEIKALQTKIVDGKVLVEKNTRDYDLQKDKYAKLNGELEPLNRVISIQQEKLNNLHRYYTDVSNKHIRICKHTNLEGKCYNLPIGFYPFVMVQKLDALGRDISSIDIPEGIKVTLSSGHNMLKTDPQSVFEGPITVSHLNRPFDKGGGIMNDNINSIKVEKMMINHEYNGNKYSDFSISHDGRLEFVPEPPPKSYQEILAQPAPPSQKKSLVGTIIDNDECCKQNNCAPCPGNYRSVGFRELKRGYCFPRVNQPIWTRRCEYTG